MQITEAITDPELGFTSFSVQRTTYRRQNGTSVPATQTMAASGCIHPGTPEMIQLLHEPEGSLWRERADLTVSLRAEETQTHPNRRNAIRTVPAIEIHSIRNS